MTLSIATTENGSITPAPDGAAVLFTISEAYRAGSLAVYYNGQLSVGEYAETDPAAGTFTIDSACFTPDATDEVAASYDDTSPIAFPDPDLLLLLDDSGIAEILVEADDSTLIVEDTTQTLSLIEDAATLALENDDTELVLLDCG